MKQRTTRRFQNIPQHKNISVRSQFIIDMFKKHSIPLLSDINYMWDIAQILDTMTNTQIKSFKKSLDGLSNCRVLNDKFSGIVSNIPVNETIKPDNTPQIDTIIPIKRTLKYNKYAK